MSIPNSPSLYSPDPNQESPRSVNLGSGQVSPEESGENNFSSPGRYNQQRQPPATTPQPPLQNQAQYQMQQPQFQQQYQQQQRGGRSSIQSQGYNQSTQSLREMAEEEQGVPTRPNYQAQNSSYSSRPSSSFSHHPRSTSPATTAGPRYVASPPPVSPASSGGGARPLSEQQQLRPTGLAGSTGPPSRGPPTIAGEPLHDLDRAVTLLKGSKFYAEGFLMKRVEVAADGKSHPNSLESQWSKWFVQLSGTIASLWNAKEMEEAARENRTVPPQYLNLSDAFLHPFPPGPRDGPTPTPYQFALNSAGLNRLLFCAPSQQSLNMWVNAIRLAGWERSRCNEIYTGALLGLREPKPLGWVGFEGGVDASKDKFQGWLKVRLPGDTEWRKVWTIVLRGEGSAASVTSAAAVKKTRRSSILGSFGRKGSVDAPAPVIEDLPGGGSLSTVAFYASKPVKKEQPLCIAQHLFYAAAIFPESEQLIDVSSLFKIEGTFLNPADGFKLGWGVGGRAEKQGFALVMHEEGDAMAMLQWIVGLADAFKLYGRPRGFSFDPRDPSSLYFALPVGPTRDRLFLDRELVDHLDINESRPRAIRAVFHNILFDRMRGVRAPQSNPPPPPAQAPVEQAPPTQLRAVNTNSEDVDEDQGPPPSRFQPRNASPQPVLPPIGEGEGTGGVFDSSVVESPTFAILRSTATSEENQRREVNVNSGPPSAAGSRSKSPLRQQDQSDSDVLENYVNYVSSDVSREPSPPHIPATQPFRTSPFAVSPLDAFKSNPAPNYLRPTPTSRPTVDTVDTALDNGPASEVTHVTYLPANTSDLNGYGAAAASPYSRPATRPTLDTVVSNSGSGSGPTSELTHVTYFAADRSDPSGLHSANAPISILARSAGPGQSTIDPQDQNEMGPGAYASESPAPQSSENASRREEMRTDTTTRGALGGGQNSLGAISAISASDYGTTPNSSSQVNSPVEMPASSAQQSSLSSARVPPPPLPSSSPSRPLPALPPPSSANNFNQPRDADAVSPYIADDSQEDFTMHSDLLAALDFANVHQSPPKPNAHPRITTDYSPSAAPVVGGRQEPPSPVDEEYASPPTHSLPSPDATRGTLKPASQPPQAFPSTFAKSKRAEERIAAAALAHQAQQEALSRPGRPSKGKGKQKAWVDSDEDEEDEDLDDDSDDDGGAASRMRSSRDALSSREPSSSEIRSLADSQRASRFPPTPPNGQSQYAQEQYNNGARDRQSYYDNGPESYQASPSEGPNESANPRVIKPFVSPHGLLHAGIIEKEERSARAIENEARNTGGPLLSIPSKPPPPQTGLVGAITSHQREKERTGGMGRALTDQQRERKLAEHRQKQLDDFQRQQLQQQQMQMQAMQQYPNSMFMNPMAMNPWMMGGMGGYPGMGMSPGLPPPAGGAPQPGPMSSHGPPGQMSPGAAPDPQMLHQQALQQQAMLAAQMAYQQAMAQFAPQYPTPSAPGGSGIATPPVNPVGAMPPSGSYFAGGPPLGTPPFGFGQPPFPGFPSPYAQVPYNPYAMPPPPSSFGQHPTGGSDSLSPPRSRQASGSYDAPPEDHRNE